LIPDQITRTVFLQKIAKRFDMEESVLMNELIKLRNEIAAKEQKEQTQTSFITPAQIKTEEIQIESQKIKVPAAEYDLIRLMVLYGANAVKVTNIEPDGKKTEVETSVIELICHELHQDELVFDTPVFARIHELYTAGLAANELFKSSYLKKLEDQEIVQFVCNIEATEMDLSPNWKLKYNISTNREFDHLEKTIPNAVYAFKSYKIVKRMDEIDLILENFHGNEPNDELDLLVMEKISLDKIKLNFAQPLGRTILR
jgi:hypothetical protein